MKNIHAKITLKNIDIGYYNRGIIKRPKIRQTTVKAVVDTGTGTLVISRAVQKELGLKVIEEREATLVDKTIKMCKFTEEPVEIHWGDRSTAVRAVVADGIDEVLLGAIPLEEMNIMVDRAHSTLTDSRDKRLAIPA
jgi:clan AA aspartic protease